MSIPAQTSEEVIQNFGDGVAALFEQAMRCDFVDEHGHRLVMNTALLHLRDIMIDTMRFRAEVLGYIEVSRAP